ncbi:MAG: restriction endonuclease subunit M, partial [Methanobrevibacter boviskoreani]|nr:restriction endonuclease subunit M [Methanobrevibacter boviskoreani]
MGHILSLPIIFKESEEVIIEDLVRSNISICKKDWDSYETYWNFNKHPLLNYNSNLIENNFENWVDYKNWQFNLLKSNETELNKIFAKIYNVDIDCAVEDKYVSVSLADY